MTSAEIVKPTEPALGCWYLTGPTASGKTAVGVELAKKLNAEIVALDSMTIYRDMDIGTAKPAQSVREQVPHHQIDIVDPSAEYSVSDYIRSSHELIDEIQARGKEVLFVGGTALYLKSMLRGLFDGPAADWEFRQEVDAEIERVGLGALHERLTQVDPVSAGKLHPHDKRRIIRALEVYKITGQPLSHFQLQFEEGRPADACKVFVLSWPRQTLHERIDQRVDSMFQAGLVDETRALREKYAALSRTAGQAVGYREAAAVLDETLDLDAATTAVKSRTHQFARRQETWFRSLSECRTLAAQDHAEPEQIADHILSQVNSNA